MKARSAAVFVVILVLPLTSAAAGDLGLLPPRESVTSVLGPQAVALADVDLDGKLDAVVVGKTSATFACYPGRGDGTFGEEMTSGFLYLQPTDLVTGDFNGDGFVDLFAINNACSS